MYSPYLPGTWPVDGFPVSSVKRASVCPSLVVDLGLDLNQSLKISTFLAPCFYFVFTAVVFIFSVCATVCVTTMVLALERTKNFITKKLCRCYRPFMSRTIKKGFVGPDLVSPCCGYMGSIPRDGTLVGYTFSKRYKKVSPHRKLHNLPYNLLREKNKPSP